MFTGSLSSHYTTFVYHLGNSTVYFCVYQIHSVSFISCFKYFVVDKVVRYFDNIQRTLIHKLKVKQQQSGYDLYKASVNIIYN